jgi:hypothetical protein
MCWVCGGRIWGWLWLGLNFVPAPVSDLQMDMDMDIDMRDMHISKCAPWASRRTQTHTDAVQGHLGLCRRPCSRVGAGAVCRCRCTHYFVRTHKQTNSCITTRSGSLARPRRRLQMPCQAEHDPPKPSDRPKCAVCPSTDDIWPHPHRRPHSFLLS